MKERIDMTITNPAETAVRKVKVASGYLTYREQGKGPVMVLLHGALLNANTWQSVIGPLSKNFRCIAPDLPLGGHNEVLAESADLSPPGIAEILDTFLKALNIDDFILLGNDTGGAYAQVYAALHPEKVSHLVLSNCDALNVFPPKHFSSLQKFINVPGYLFVMGILFRLKPFLASPMVFGLLSHRLTGDQLYTRFSHNFAKSSGVRCNFRKVVNGWSPKHTLTAANHLKKFEKPVLLLWGEDDHILFPLSLGQELAGELPNARLEIIPQSLTYVHEDQPEMFVDRVSKFLENCV